MIPGAGQEPAVDSSNRTPATRLRVTGAHSPAVRYFLALLALALVSGIGAFLWYRQASQPAHDGTFTVAGLSAAVGIVRDAEGVPHIAATSEADALFALGYAHAQDRLWQIDFNRRIVQGRLSEVVGPAGLDTDRFLRTLGLYRTALAITSNLDAETRAMLDAYAAGINGYLSTRKGPLPPEFLMTRAPVPADWTAADSVAWSLLMALDLSRTWQNELARLRLSTRLTKAEIDDFRPPYPGDAPLVAADYVALYRDTGLLAATTKSGATSIVSQATRLAALDVVHPFGDGDGIGSNNWVVAGARSASGHPMLANDPHLGLTTPSIWYFARLSAPGLEVFGATFPGLPYVVLGRNAAVAWGATNTGPDVQDFYIERINPGDPNEYQTPEGFAKFDVREEIIKVKGEDDVRLAVRGTRHGPVLSDALEDVAHVDVRRLRARVALERPRAAGPHPARDPPHQSGPVRRRIRRSHARLDDRAAELRVRRHGRAHRAHRPRPHPRAAIGQ